MLFPDDHARLAISQRYGLDYRLAFKLLPTDLPT
jgi:hypothetical protein